MKQRLLFFTLLLSIWYSSVYAQTTITTATGTTGYAGDNASLGNACVTFVVENTSSSPVVLNRLEDFVSATGTPAAGSNFVLWYSATSLSGAVTIASPAWTQIAFITSSGLTTGYNPIFNNLNLTIPAGTQYRFALQSTGGIAYSGTGAGTASPSILSASGVNLKVGEALINGAVVGYAGSFPSPTLSPRWFTGAISFSSTVACSGTPAAGNITSSTGNTACSGSSFTLGLNGSTFAAGLTYQWQSSFSNGNFSNITGANSYTLTTSQTASTYYRVSVTCGGNTRFSDTFLITTPALIAGNYTINNNAPASGTNFQSFNAAANFMRCGINGAVTFTVNPTSGPYNEQLILPEIPGASATNTVTFSGNGRTIRYSSTNTNERAVIKLNGADHIRFDSLTIDATPTGTATTYGYGVQFINNADSNAIRRCTILAALNNTSFNYAGVVLNASASSAIANGATLCDSNYIASNTISGGMYGVTLLGSTTDAVQRNVVAGNTIRDFYQYGVYVSNTFSTLIEGNDISRPTITTLTTFNGIYATGISTYLNISKNRIHNPYGGAITNTSGGYGIYFNNADALSGLENNVTNNLVYDMNGAGILYAFYNVGSDLVRYYHNTISLDNAASTTATIRGFFQTGAAAGIEFINNIITLAWGGTGQKHAVYLGTTTSIITLNRNNYFIGQVAGSTNNFTGYYNANQATLTNWQTASGQDVNSVSIDPVYAAASAGNFAPTSVFVNDLGTPVGVTTDITGAARSATVPDMGAYEFSVLPCTGTPIAGTLATATTTVCPNTAFTLTVTGSSSATGLTYQWQTSADGITWVNIPAATSPSLTIAQAASAYYRRITTCTASGSTANTNALLVTSPALVSGTYTINSTAPTGSGNFQTFNAAYDYIRCGINGPVVFTVNATSGPYNEQLIMADVPGTSVFNTVSFNGNGRTIRYSSTNPSERAVIKLNGTDHIRFDSLLIDATPVGTATTYGFGFQFINNADSNVLRNCTITTAINSFSTNYAGIVMNAANDAATSLGTTYCDSNFISGNTVTGGYYGITLVGGTNDAIQRNVVVGNTIRDFYNYGLYISYTTNSLIERNDISRPTATTVSSFYGIYANGASLGLTISKNRIHNPFTGVPTSTNAFYGIYSLIANATATAKNLVVNNLISNIDGQGETNGMYNLGSNFTQYFHNTISLDNTTSTATSATRGFYQTSTAGGIEFSNNIISISRGGTGIKHAVYLATPGIGFTANRNDYFINAVAGASYIGYSSGNQASLAAWQAATNQDGGSVVANPVYISPATGNFTPASVVLNNIGLPLGVTTDLVGVVRSITTPDPGAYEFAVPGCTVPPVAGNASAVPNTAICLGTNVLLSLPGATTGSGQTVQWQFASTATGPWTNLGAPLLVADTVISASITFYYRAIVTCGTVAVTATPVLVSVNPALLSGFYTINPALPASATNFQTFTAAVAAMECGIAGFVTFDVSPGTYNERVRMHRIFGAGANSRVTFRSLSGVPSSVTLTSAAATATANYVLQLDSASFITYRNISIAGTNTTNARVIDFSNTASSDSIVNCIITAPVGTGTANTSAGIFANTLVGTSNVIKGNTIVNGINGIYFSGVSAALPSTRNTIDSNTVNGAYYYGIYTAYNNRLQVSKNTVNTAPPLNSLAYSIYALDCDSAYQFINNQVNISNATGTAYGLYLTQCDGRVTERASVANNKITATAGNSGSLYGLYQSQSNYNNTVNNVINVGTAGTTAYGIYNLGGSFVNFWNNTVQNISTAAGTLNMAAYFAQSDGLTNIQNNIFSHTGGGVALGYTNTYPLYSDYNMLYTTGATLVSSVFPGGTYATLQDWRNASAWDANSIVYPPAFVSTTDLSPNIASPNVWAMHGRGTQIPENNYDINNNPRPTTLQAGVPDLGAYEFLPTSTPVALTALPATPVAGGTQTFTLGTDTVTRITWPAGSLVPPSITLRRYSGILPPGVAATQQRMYFYVDADTMPPASYNATVRQYYIDPWQGFILNQAYIKMGKTSINGQWVVNSQSTVNEVENYITETGIGYLDKFTGLTDGTAPTQSMVQLAAADSSNRGTQFWASYGNNTFFRSGNLQDMVIYLSAEQAANVTIKVNGTTYSRTYSVPANTAIATAPIPKSGSIDARLPIEGLSNRGISISSDVPITAYAHIYYNESSGATLLLPVGTYGYEYTSLNTPQISATASDNSWVNVIAAYDSTVVQITPSNPTVGGRAAGVPFTVLMNKGDVYQVLGASLAANTGYDMSGTKVLSVPNPSGRCYPVAVFSGSSRTGFGCDASIQTGTSDNVIQQNFPSQAWGRRYLVAPTSNAASANTLMTNIIRVAVKDPATVVTRNGVALTGLINNYYYQFESNTADYIQADRPIAVAQLMSSSNSNCSNTSGDGDPEIIYISPIEQGVKRATIYRNTASAIRTQYVTLLIPTTGVTSLRIDGSNTFDYMYPHPNLAGYTVVVKRWNPATAAQTVIVSDSNFTAITYGLGNLESYGYNVGTLVKSLTALPGFNNTFNSIGTTSQYTCVRSPFRVSVQIPLRPTQLIWNFSAIPNITPNANIIQSTPVLADSSLINGTWYYRYTLQQDYTISDTGTYYLPVTFSSPSIEGCNSSLTVQLRIVVRPAILSDFTATPAVACVGTPIQFNGRGPSATDNINRWNWAFPDTTTATVQNPVKIFATPGTKNISLRVITAEGCIGDTVKAIVVNPLPTLQLVRDTLLICPGTADTLRIANPVAGTTYNWYNVATGGTPLFTGTAYAVTTTGVYYAEAVQAGCASIRRRAVVTVYNQLATPVVTVDSAGVNLIRFRWNAVAGAVSYSVSTDGGTTFISPGSGPTGLTHIVTPVAALSNATLIVRANGAFSCQNTVSAAVTGRTLPDQIYIPNAFTPNGDGRNDVWQVYSYTIRNIRMMVYNQWGEKIFESSNQQTGWDGTYKGQQQPVGVYVYVIQLVLNDGTQLNRKGSINLAR